MGKAMGESKKSPNHVPLRIKIHDEDHLDLLEGLTQDVEQPDGAGSKCDAWKAGSSGRPEGCSDWDKPHATPCRRRAGCKSRGLPVPSFSSEEADEEYDDEEFDLDNIDLSAEVV